MQTLHGVMLLGLLRALCRSPCLHGNPPQTRATPPMPSPLCSSFRLEKSFPEEYAARRREEQAAAAAPAGGAPDAPLPMFVMSLLLPGAKVMGDLCHLLCASLPGRGGCRYLHSAEAAGQGVDEVRVAARSLESVLTTMLCPRSTLGTPAGEVMALNIFEPRYRLMVRRCMEGNRRFAMGTVDRQHRIGPVSARLCGGLFRAVHTLFLGAHKQASHVPPAAVLAHWFTSGVFHACRWRARARSWSASRCPTVRPRRQLVADDFLVVEPLQSLAPQGQASTCECLGVDPLGRCCCTAHRPCCCQRRCMCLAPPSPQAWAAALCTQLCHIDCWHFVLHQAGRFYIEIVGRRRFQPSETWEQARRLLPCSTAKSSRTHHVVCAACAAVIGLHANLAGCWLRQPVLD